MAESRIPVVVSDSTAHVTPEDAAEAGMRVGTVYNKVGVAIDADATSVIVAKAFMAGLNAVGANVEYAGLCPTPAACLALRNCDLIVTVGCPDVSGRTRITFYHTDGSLFSAVDLRILEAEPSDIPSWSGVGALTTMHEADSEYIDYIHNSGLRISGYIVMDCACGSTSRTAPLALSGIGADISTMDADTRIRKPRNPGLNKSEMLLLSNFVNASTGSIGIAYNGDGTSLSVMDENGKYVPPEGLLALMLMYFEPRVAVIPFDSPALVEDAFYKPLGLRQDGHGGDDDRRIIRAVTDEEVFQYCRENDADFAALGDGRFIFPEMSLCPDAILSSAFISELSGLRSLRNVLEELPVYFTKVVSLPFSGIPRMFSNKFAEAISFYQVDDFTKSGFAWKVIMKNGIYSVMLRNNEIVIKAESGDPLYLTTMTEQAVEIVSSCM